MAADLRAVAKLAISCALTLPISESKHCHEHHKCPALRASCLPYVVLEGYSIAQSLIRQGCLVGVVRRTEGSSRNTGTVRSGQQEMTHWESPRQV